MEFLKKFFKSAPNIEGDVTDENLKRFGADPNLTINEMMAKIDAEVPANRFRGVEINNGRGQKIIKVINIVQK